MKPYTLRLALFALLMGALPGCHARFPFAGDGVLEFKPPPFWGFHGFGRALVFPSLTISNNHSEVYNFRNLPPSDIDNYQFYIYTTNKVPESFASNIVITTTLVNADSDAIVWTNTATLASHWHAWSSYNVERQCDEVRYYYGAFRIGEPAVPWLSFSPEYETNYRFFLSVTDSNSPPLQLEWTPFFSTKGEIR